MAARSPLPSQLWLRLVAVAMGCPVRSQRGRAVRPVRSVPIMASPMTRPPTARAPPRQSAETANPDTAMIASLVRISVSPCWCGICLRGIDQAEMQPCILHEPANEDVQQQPGERAQSNAGGDQAETRQRQCGAAAQDAAGSEHDPAGEQREQPD